MWQLELAHVPIEGWVIDSDEYCFFDVSGNTISSLPTILKDTLVMPQPDGSIKTTVFRKPTHTDMYSQWDSYHHLSAKYSVINTLRHRTKTVCSTRQLLTEEEDHLYNALRRCKYPLWAWNRVNISKNQKRNNHGKNKNSNSNNTKKPYIVVPYMKGLGETCKTCAGDMEWRCISGEEALSGIYWYTLRTGTPH